MKPSSVLERSRQIRLTLAEDHSDQEGCPSTVRLLSMCQLIPSWKSVSHTNKHMHLSTAESRRRGKWQRHKEPSYCSWWGFAKQDVPFISRSFCVCAALGWAAAPVASAAEASRKMQCGTLAAPGANDSLGSTRQSIRFHRVSSSTVWCYLVWDSSNDMELKSIFISLNFHSKTQMQSYKTWI